ncbi:hypothetical protein PSHT_04793 [Puccinia striiformis]|uniref:Uncharacterized protein n=1 Tax=Puccinia striiformis TaxID=27350 RepID=A0A2S4WC83_9BASI|nr:hypothetical protein PSHT_04793 [Puccinia striiformis]
MDRRVAIHQRWRRTPRVVTVDQLARLLEAIVPTRKLGKATEPQLVEDRTNFPDWKVALYSAFSRVFEVKKVLFVGGDGCGRWLQANEELDVSDELNLAYAEARTGQEEIEKRVGMSSHNLVLALVFHQRCRTHFQEIANALDARLAVNPLAPIAPGTVLELAGKYGTGAVSGGASTPESVGLAQEVKCMSTGADGASLVRQSAWAFRFGGYG